MRPYNPAPVPRQLTRLPPALPLAVASLASAALLLALFTDLTFWRDEWSLLLHRRGFNADALLEPNYEHIVLAPALVYKALLAVFGMDSPRPFQIVAVLTFLASTTLLWVWMRRRVGGWPALAGVLPMLFLGPSGDDLLWPFQIGYFGSVVFGLAALLALEGERREWDVVACVALLVSMSFSSVGIPFAIGVAVYVLTGPDRSRRSYVFLVPVALFAVWWLGYGRHAENNASVHDVLTSPGYVLDGFAAALSSLTGLGTTRNDTQVGLLDWGRPLLAVVLVFAGMRLVALGRIPRGLWIALAVALGFWVLTAFNSVLFRHPDNGRYQYLGVVFLLLVLAELFRGVRPRGWVTVTLLAASLMAAGSNADFLRQYWRGIKPQGELTRAGLGALELTRGVVAPGFELTPENSGVDYLGHMDAGSYFSAVDSFGSPAFAPAELHEASESARAAADRVFASALRLRLTEAEPASCMGAFGGMADLPEGGALFVNDGRQPVEIRLARYASETFPFSLGRMAPGAAMRLEIADDRSDVPWRASVAGRGTVHVCPLP
jgi:hypothetical protein